MAFKEVSSLDADVTVALGGINRKTGKKNPTSAEGYYLGNRPVTNKTGESKLHFLQTPKGKLGVWGKTDMDKKLASVVPGTMIRISFTGMQPTPKGDMYKFKVEVDDANTIEVNAATAGTNEAYDDGAGDDEGAFDTDEVDEQDEDDSQTQALAALERKKKVEALLKGKTAKN